MVKIISDSTCDLTPDLLSKYDIDILPLHILLGEKEYKDGINITPDQIYSWSDANKTTPKTSAPALSETIELFRPYVEEGRNIVCFSISNSMSSSGNVMQLAAEELNAQDLITVIDSANLSTGIGLLVIEAAILAQNNKTAAEISVAVESLKPYVRASFVVDTLTYLHRGGRCSAIAAMAGGLLKLHPQIIVEHGAMKPTKKYRGKMDSVILSYVKDMEPALKHARPDRVFITHSGCEPTIINAVRSYLEGLGIFREILETRAGGVISSHCGYRNPRRFIHRILICLSFLSAEFTYRLPKRAGIFLSEIRSGNTQLPPALSEESGSAQQPAYPTSQDSYAHDHAAVFSSFSEWKSSKSA